MSDISLALGDSPLPQALNAYYSYLVEILRPSPTRRIALNDIITPADIYQNTNFYNQYIFRCFVDRLVMTSPTDYSLGNTNVTSSYSYYWSMLLQRVIVDIDINLGLDIQNQIEELDRQISDLRKEYVKIRSDLETKWSKIANKAGLDPKTDKYYIFKKKKFADDAGYATQLNGVKNGIFQRLTKQNQLRLKELGDPEDQILIQTYQYATFEEYKTLLPIIPDFERQDGLSASDLTNLAVSGAAGQFEADADIRPVGDLRNFFSNEKGKDEIGIDSNTTIKHDHDSEWSVSASGSYGFFSASVSTDNEKHIRDSLTKIRKITVGWNNMDNYPVRRGRWFNLDVLGYKKVGKILKSDPRLKAQLSRTVASLIIARGLYITLEFTDISSMERWEKSSFGGSGGVSVFGVSFGGGGSSYEYDYSLVKDTTKQTVTIKDDPNYARVCAFVSEEVIPGVSQSDITKEFAQPQLYTPQIISELIGGLKMLP